MNENGDQRDSRRVLAVCRVFDLQRKFLGFTLDLSRTGIKIIVNKEFVSEDEFEIILSYGREFQEKNPDIVIKVQQAWRVSNGEEFDQIGGRIIDVESIDKLTHFISYCDTIEKEKYYDPEQEEDQDENQDDV